MSLHRPPLIALATLATLAAGLAATTALPAGTAAAATRRADLLTTSVRTDRAATGEAGVITVRHRVRNTGTARAAATTTRFYLTRDPATSRAARATSTSNPRTAPTDLLLVGSAAVPAIPAGSTGRTLTTRVGVPVGTAPGSYRLLACADDRGTVTERNEADNCSPATTPVRVTAAPGTDTMVLRAYADTTPWMPDEQLSTLYLKMMCSHTVAPSRMSPATALARLKAMLTAAGGKGILDRIAASGLADTALDAQRLAAEGGLQDSPGLALAGLLRAHDLEPRIGTHLINAAAVAVGMGRPNEALALLDGAAPLDLRRGAMGIDPQYVALVVRGEALVMTGRPGQARPLFQAVRVAEPRLSEADAGLAAIEACSGHDALAGRYARRARQRDQRPKPPAEDPTAPEPTRPAPALDLSRGKPTMMRKVTIPDSPSDGVVLAPTYVAIDQGFEGEIQAEQARSEELQQRLDGAAPLLDEGELDRRDSLMAAAAGADSPELGDLADRLDRKLRLMADLRDDFFGGPGHEDTATVRVLSDEAAKSCVGKPDTEGCYHDAFRATCRPELSRVHTQWRGLLGEAQTVAEEYVAAQSRLVSAYAANLSDDAAHDMVLLGITTLERTTYSRLVETAMIFTGLETTWQDDCVDEPDPYTPPPPVTAPAPDAYGPCPELLRSTTFTLDLGVSKIAVNCDSITQSFEAEAFPWVSAFADLTWDLRSGQLTVFAGSKGAVKVGNVLDLSFKSGVYLTSDGKGGIKDVGIRTNPSAELSQGIASYGAASDQVDFSFLAPFREDPPRPR